MCARKNATARALSLGRRRSSRACVVRAPRRAGWSRSVTYGSSLRQRGAISLGARPCSDMPAAASTEQLTCACAQVKKRHCVRFLSLGRRPARALSACARPAALVGVGPCPMEPTSPAKRPSRSVHGHIPTCQPRPPTSSLLAYMRKENSATARALSLGRKRSTRAFDVRALRRAGWSRLMPYGSPLLQRVGHLTH